MASAQPTSFDCFTGQHLSMSYQWSAAMLFCSRIPGTSCSFRHSVRAHEMFTHSCPVGNVDHESILCRQLGPTLFIFLDGRDFGHI